MLKVCFVFLLFLTISCTRKLETTSTSIIIQAPKKWNKSASSLNAFPDNRKICYGVNVTAADLIDAPANSCEPDRGIMAGYVEAGVPLEVEVPKGAGRRIEVLAFVFPEGINDPCPQMRNTFTDVDMARLYTIGVAEGVELKDSEQQVNIQANFPDQANHWAADKAIPGSCYVAMPDPVNGVTPSNPAPPGSRIISGGGVASSASFKLKSKIGQAVQNKNAQSSNFKIK